MNKNSVLNHLMCLRMNSVMNSITEQDKGYQALLREADHHTTQLEGIPISTSTLSKIEQGACNPATVQLVALRKILGCDYGNFFRPC